MNYEQQRRIAEACGWRNVHASARYELSDVPSDHGKLIGERDGCGWDFVPDYPRDLNGMRDAEETLRDDAERDAYKDALESVCDGWVWHASAEERGRAFCMILDRRAFILANVKDQPRVCLARGVRQHDT